MRSCVFLGAWKAGVEDDALGTFRPSCFDSSCSEGGCWSGPAVWVGGIRVSPVVNDTCLWQVVPYEDLIYLIPNNLLTDELMEELQGMAEDWVESGCMKDGSKERFSSMHVPVVEDVRIAQQKAETKQRALLVIDEPTETPEKPRRRILCRSTHDKTRKDWDACKLVSGKNRGILAFNCIKFEYFQQLPCDSFTRPSRLQTPSLTALWYIMVDYLTFILQIELPVQLPGNCCSVKEVHKEYEKPW